MKRKFNLYKFNEKEMKEIQGGYICGCACQYATTGGSSTAANGVANHDGGGLYSDSENIIQLVV
jgi:natural product precursor